MFKNINFHQCKYQKIKENSIIPICKNLQQRLLYVKHAAYKSRLRKYMFMCFFLSLGTTFYITKSKIKWHFFFNVSLDKIAFCNTWIAYKVWQKKHMSLSFSLYNIMQKFVNDTRDLISYQSTSCALLPNFTISSTSIFPSVNKKINKVSFL